ncbi:50 kDa protein in type i retrotransposable element r1dm [Thalictrum thalictroides]|uniref:50 kDa protein in type i retrotransposable element r1dm n=1 Tax=Thalictrum thalictroides TaxID=46969 RepID=A0A7J6WRC7_THATH|nr:50 kDa protein in type i retrotransposable element r1dm [Thalictrum thalictroides]
MWKPHVNDKGSKPDNETTAMPDHFDKLQRRAPLSHCSPLRLRGGNGDLTDENKDDNDQGGHLEITPTNVRKRKAGDSPPGSIPESISTETTAMTSHIRDCKAFLQDMVTIGKIGKKWTQGIEDFLEKVQACSHNIAVEAAILSGRYQEAKLVASEANRRLASHLTETNRKDNKKLYVSATKEGLPSTMSSEDDFMVVEEAPNPIARSIKDRLGEFPPLSRQTSNNQKRRRKRTKSKANAEKLKNAKMKPAKPAFVIDGKEGNLKLADIWKVVSQKTKNPRIDGCRRTAEGNYVVVSSDATTAEAIRTINEDLVIREVGPRKPRVKIRGIPVDYTPEGIVGMILSQNQELTGFSTEDIRPLFKCGKRDEHITDWVIEVSPKVFKRVNGKRLYVGMISTFPRSYAVPPHCRRCLLTDHKTSACKVESGTCFHCAKPGHSKKDCPSKNDKPSCAHCQGKHATMAKTCPKWAATVLALQRRTDYGLSDDEA